MARSARALRTLADRLRAVRPLGGGRDLGEAAGTRPGPRRRGRPGAVDRLGRLHGRPGPPARGRRPRKGAADRDELEDPGRSQARQALGRSRGGPTTTVHLAVDGRGLPLSIVLTPGNVDDATAFGQVLDSIRIPHAVAGRPRTTPVRVLGGKAYSSRAIRHLLWRRGIVATIPERRDQVRQARRSLPGWNRPGGSDPVAPRTRWLIICQTGSSTATVFDMTVGQAGRWSGHGGELSDVRLRAGGLRALHERFVHRFARSEPRESVLAYMRGLIAPLEWKNGWTLGEEAGHAGPDRIHRLPNRIDWDAGEVLDECASTSWSISATRRRC